MIYFTFMLNTGLHEEWKNNINDKKNYGKIIMKFEEKNYKAEF